MKKIMKSIFLMGTVTLLTALMAMSAAAAPPRQLGPGEIEIEPEPELGLGGEAEGEPEGGGSELGEDAEAEPAGAAVRIDFEVSGHKARGGLYVVQEAGGAVLAYWSARSGWVDSGWISNLDLPRETVWVEVLYYSGPGVTPVNMRILNHAPGKAYGWLSQGMAHALEVAWPDQPLMYEGLPDFSDRGL